MNTNIKDNLQRINQEIKESAEKVSRNATDVKLIAVTKLHEVSEINEAIALGVTDIGENKVQEVLKKYDDVTKGVRWHLIGHLQTNKVKSIVDKVDCIHSVDSMHLAIEINKRCNAINKIMNILLEVNAAGEESKSGVPIDEVADLYKEIKDNCPNLNVIGLMEVAPASDNPEDVRPYFKALKLKADELGLKELSMGMSGDFKVAIEEGATFVRIGTAIFGKRDYSKII